MKNHQQNYLEKHNMYFICKSESESESALFAKCVQTHEEFVVVFKKLLVHTCIHTYIHTYKHTYLTWEQNI